MIVDPREAIVRKRSNPEALEPFKPVFPRKGSSFHTKDKPDYSVLYESTESTGTIIVNPKTKVKRISNN